jgi:hypothetical protein
MSPARKTPPRDHDLRMHLGVILMALQMITRPPSAPLQSDQKELIEIMQRAAKSMEAILDNPIPTVKRKRSGETRSAK